ncbi:MAG TPA: GH92 family glycosyl hydrolase [Bacteroidia bacterium]|nr:GH92 family glycosyl hydrolase [Bacteroidia bacterium]
MQTPLINKILRASVVVLLFYSDCAKGQIAIQFVKERERSINSYVDPFVGTDGFGHTYPGASMPFGMVQLSPDTRTSGWENCSGYHTSNPTILGFSHTHLSGTGAADYGDILFMPNGSLQLEPGDESNPQGGYRSAFKHESEQAIPGYYKVFLDDYGIQAELTASTRAAMHRYKYNRNDSNYVILDLKHGISDVPVSCSIKIEGPDAVSGYRRSSGWAKDHIVFFYAEFSSPFSSGGVRIDSSASDLKEGQGRFAKAWFRFDGEKIIQLRIGISTVSVENAKLNLQTEIPDWDFQKVRYKAAVAWEKELSRIIITGDDEDAKSVFYTALYHCMLSPNIMSDVNGQYRGMDGKIHTMEKGNMYTVFSLWDTFRALHPLFTIIDPDRAQDFVRALLQKSKENGLLPVWELASNETGCMIGYHSVPVIADAFAKGLRDFDTTYALEAMQKSAMQDQLGLKYYKERGYVPGDLENESVSRTLEYAYDDWCIAAMGAGMGNEKVYSTFSKRANNYQNVYDRSTGFMRGKKNGNWTEPFDPFEVSGMYTEANAWQYTFFAPHDIPGLMHLMGGPAAFAVRLDSLFSTSQHISGRSQPDISGMIGQYAHGNEPSHNMAYLYMFTPERYKTAEIVRKLMNKMYSINRDGLSGNEDCGQMSAWYVLSAIGLYPVCPGTDYYIYGSPLFSKVEIHPGNGKTCTITAESNSGKNIYPAEVLLNGKTTHSYVRNSTLLDGGNLTFKMSSKPLVPAFETPEPLWHYPVTPVPYLQSGPKAFTDSCRVAIEHIDKDATLYYAVSTDSLKMGAKMYTQPFYLKQSCTVSTFAVSKGKDSSYTDEATFIRIPYNRSVLYTTPYSHLYTAGGTGGLVDGIRGEPGVFGNWQGFQGSDMKVTVDLGGERQVSAISTGFLQQYPSWIWVPVRVKYEVSMDGKTFMTVYDKPVEVDEKEEGSFIKNILAEGLHETAKYVRVTAYNRSVCPDWHPGAGEPAWIFADEIEIY